MIQQQEHYLVVTLKQPDDEADLVTTDGDPMAFDTFKRFNSDAGFKPVRQYTDSLEQPFVIIHTKSVIRLLEKVTGLGVRQMRGSFTTGGRLS